MPLEHKAIGLDQLIKTLQKVADPFIRLIDSDTRQGFISVTELLLPNSISGGYNEPLSYVDLFANKGINGVLHGSL